MGQIDLPRSIEELEANEVNALVRRVIRSVSIQKSEVMRLSKDPKKRAKGVMVPRPTYDLIVSMKNGVRLVIGEGPGGLA